MIKSTVEKKNICLKRMGGFASTVEPSIVFSIALGLRSLKALHSGAFFMFGIICLMGAISTITRKTLAVDSCLKELALFYS